MPQPPLYPRPSEPSNLIGAPLPRKRGCRRLATVPANVSPIVRLVFEQIRQQEFRYDDVEHRSGVRRPALKSWRRRSRPSWESLEAVLGALNFHFYPTPELEILPPKIAGELTALAIKLRKDIPGTWAALINIGVEQRLLKMRAHERAAILAAHDARRTGHSNDNKPQAD